MTLGGPDLIKWTKWTKEFVSERHSPIDLEEAAPRSLIAARKGILLTTMRTTKRTPSLRQDPSPFQHLDFSLRRPSVEDPALPRPDSWHAELWDNGRVLFEGAHSVLICGVGKRKLRQTVKQEQCHVQGQLKSAMQRPEKRWATCLHQSSSIACFFCAEAHRSWRMKSFIET